jgi:hypothetical protein
MTFFILTLAIAAVAVLALRKRHSPDEVIELDESDIWTDVRRTPPPPPPRGRRAPALSQQHALIH